MSDLHPNWQPTDSPPVPDRTGQRPGGPNGTFGRDEEQPLPVRVVRHDAGTPTIVLPRFATVVSRQPAAIAGILLAVTIGLTLFLSSDRPESGGPTVHITKKGFSPQGIEVTAGERITWVNDSTMTHILQSDELCASDRRCLVTRPIAPGTSTSLLISQAFTPGTSTYYSISVQGLTGTVTILPSTGMTDRNAIATVADSKNLEAALPYRDLMASTLSPAESSASSRAARALPSDDSAGDFSGMADDSVFDPNSSFLLGAVTPPSDGQQSSTGVDDLHGAGPTAGAFSSAVSRRTNANALIPMNPYTVGSDKTHPFDASGNPLAGGTSSSSKAKTTVHSGAPSTRPISQPATGAGTALVILGSIGMLGFFTRKELKKNK